MGHSHGHMICTPGPRHGHAKGVAVAESPGHARPPSNCAWGVKYEISRPHPDFDAVSDQASSQLSSQASSHHPIVAASSFS